MYTDTLARAMKGIECVPTGFEKLIVVANHASNLDGLVIWTFLRLPFRIIGRSCGR
jgi:1-acyl-sn-glycerol-3-phosphate acyltransferase